MHREDFPHAFFPTYPIFLIVCVKNYYIYFWFDFSKAFWCAFCYQILSSMCTSQRKKPGPELLYFNFYNDHSLPVCKDHSGVNQIA